MCGFAGLLTPRCGWRREELDACLRQMCNAIAHRGPDGSGYWIDAAAGAALGHRRLAILDLSPAGHQPMVSPNGRWVVCFNGELYNHDEVRAQLEQQGYRFRGHSDTETLVAACQQWGLAESLPRFAGMFAIALWDVQERCLYLARDRMGEKPLYFGRVGQAFVFASELKALLQTPGWSGDLEPTAVRAYFDCGYVPAPWSIYRGIRKLSPGCWMRIPIDAIDEEPQEVPYWRLDDVIGAGEADPITDPADAVTALETELSTVIRQQMVSDVPLGAFLSGGIDSSCVVALMQRQSSRRIRTFTIGFDEPQMDESAHARLVARHLGTEHTEMRVTGSDALDLIPYLPAIYDEPFADQSQLPTVLLARLTRQHVTVSLSGDGGDELFAGYSHYASVLRMWNWLAHCPQALLHRTGGAASKLVSSLALAASWMGGSAPRRLSQLHTLGLILGGVGPEHIADALTNPNLGRLVAGNPDRCETRSTSRHARHPLGRLMAHDQRRWLPDDILVKVDRATMAASLESRAPFLDHRIVELAWRMPATMNFRDGVSKRILRQVLHRHVPQTLFERPKQGFCIPIAEWLRGPLNGWARDLLKNSHACRLGILHARAAEELLRDGFRSVHVERRLWTVLMFESWLRDNQSSQRLERAA